MWPSWYQDVLYSFGGVAYSATCSDPCLAWYWDFASDRWSYSVLENHQSVDSVNTLVYTANTGPSKTTWERSGGGRSRDDDETPPVFGGYTTEIFGSFWSMGGKNVSRGKTPSNTNTLQNITKFEYMTKVWDSTRWDVRDEELDLRSRAAGVAVSAPMFGKDGIILFFGGLSHLPDGRDVISESPADTEVRYLPLDRVYIHDIRSDTYMMGRKVSMGLRPFF